MNEGQGFEIKYLGLIECKKVNDNCSICKTKWASEKTCPNGHEEGRTYFIQERTSFNKKQKKRLVRCDAFGNRCSICGSYFDECGVCNNMHIIDQLYEV